MKYNIIAWLLAFQGEIDAAALEFLKLLVLVTNVMELDM